LNKQTKQYECTFQQLLFKRILILGRHPTHMAPFSVNITRFGYG